MMNKYLEPNPEKELCVCGHDRWDHINTRLVIPPWYLFYMLFSFEEDIDSECNWSDEFNHCTCTKFKPSGKYKKR